MAWRCRQMSGSSTSESPLSETPGKRARVCVGSVGKAAVPWKSRPTTNPDQCKILITLHHDSWFVLERDSASGPWDAPQPFAGGQGPLAVLEGQAIGAAVVVCERRRDVVG